MALVRDQVRIYFIDYLGKISGGILSRFQEVKSAVGPKESVRDNFDRVNSSVHLSANDSLVAMRLDRDIRTADQGFQACITHFMQVHYMSGLKPEVRRLGEAKFSSLKTKEDLVKAAVKAEVASGQEARTFRRLRLSRLHYVCQPASLSSLDEEEPSLVVRRGLGARPEGVLWGDQAISPTSRRCPIA